jgi:hypothetical protein
MGYKADNFCFQTVEQLHKYVAAQCEPISGGYSVVCTPYNPATVIDVQSTHLGLGTQTTTSFTPSLINCDYLGADYISFLWLLAGLMVVAFGARLVSDVIRGK